MSDHTLNMDDARAALAKLEAGIEADEPAPAPIPIRRGGGSSPLERCRRYVAKMPPAIAGQGGHNQCFAVACTCYRFGLSESEARQVIEEYSARCQPPWSEREISHKARSAHAKITGNGTFGEMLRLPDASLPPASSFDDEEPRFQFYTDIEFDALDLRIEWHIPGLFASGAIPAMVAGAGKTLKTSVIMHMLNCLAAGTPFLDHEVKQCPVAIMSGETGGSTLQDLLRRIRQCNGTQPTGNLHICCAVPSLRSGDDLLAIEEVIHRTGARVFVIDPAYLALRGLESPGDMFAVGEFLLPITELAVRTGCTPIIIHHVSKGAARDRVGEPAELPDMAMAGFDAWAAQWLLLSRRRKYDAANPGEHEMWLNIGGRDGHSKLLALDIHEGAYPDRYWRVEANGAAEAREAATEAAEDRREAAKRDKTQRQLEADADAIYAALTSGPDTARGIREGRSGVVRRERVTAAIAKLLRDGKIEECEIVKNKRMEIGYHIR